MRYHLNSSWMWGCDILALGVPAPAACALVLVAFWATDLLRLKGERRP
ncbi:hypothetical protein V1293_004042 [Bradyrhizobium sp. AZCC 1693]